MADSRKSHSNGKNGASKSTSRRSTTKRKSSGERKIGTTSGATQRYFPIAQTSAPQRDNSLIQVDKMLNIMNRRIYRQHKVYTVQVELDSKAEPDQPGQVVELYALKNTWANRKAFALAKEMYDEAVSQERATVGDARWHDFRISGLNCFADTDTNGVFPIATLADATRQAVLLENGEYGSSVVTSTNAVGVAAPMTFGLLPTTTATQYSVFLEFANTGPRVPTDPGNPSPGGYERVSGTDYEIGNVEDLLDNGNFPPYSTLGNQSVLSGGPWHKVGELFHNPNGESQLRTGYFEAPLGMVVAVNYNTLFGTDAVPVRDATNLLSIRVKEGDYKGVQAEDI
jgi:hypothetical protein